MSNMLDVWLDIGGEHLAVGRLAWRDHRALFEFDTKFVDRGLPLSPLRLPLAPGVQTAPREPFRGLFGMFADCLPDSYGRLLIDRRLRAIGRNPSALTPLDRLALVGERGFGALRFRPTDDLETEQTSFTDLDRLQIEALAVIAGEPSELLSVLQQLGGSAGGARPKAQIWLGEGSDRIETQPMPATEPWLVKFRAPTDLDDIGAIEAAYASMAMASGIDVAPYRLLPSKFGPGHFASRRFDRDASGPLHLHSLAGVIEADPDGASVSYREYLRVAHFLTRDIRRVEEAFRRMVFNVVAYNRDDHARNHAFLMDAAGRWSLSPAFDLTFSPGPGGEHYLAVAGQGKAITHEHLITEGRAAGLPFKLLETCIDEVRSAVAEWRKFASAAGVTAARTAEIQAAIKIGSAI